jgi:hypothetical protein
MKRTQIDNNDTISKRLRTENSPNDPFARVKRRKIRFLGKQILFDLVY